MSLPLSPTRSRTIHMFGRRFLSHRAIPDTKCCHARVARRRKSRGDSFSCNVRVPFFDRSRLWIFNCRRNLMRRRYSFASAIVVLLVTVLIAQGTQAQFSFEVASIRPAPPFSLDKMLSGQIHVGSIKGSEADFQFVSLMDLLVYAYRVKTYQIAGPTWIRDGRWDI